MSERYDALEAAVGNIEPHIVQFMADHGPEAFDHYMDTRVFHVTHESHVPAIMQEGLHAATSPVDAEDLTYISGMFERYGSRHPNNIYMFGHYILGQRQGENRGLYLSLRGKNSQLGDQMNASYGVPERVPMLMGELAAMQARAIGTPAEQTQAKQIFDKYYERYFYAGSRVVMLEVNPLAPPVINHRLAHIDRLSGDDPDLVAMILASDSRDVNLRNGEIIEPEYLSVHSSATGPVDTWRQVLTSSARDSSYFPNLL